DDLVPALAKNRIGFLGFDQLNGQVREWIEKYYFTEVRPVLTPLVIDPAHPFPQLLNKSLNMMVQLEMAHSGQVLRHLAVVQVPRVLPRLVRLPGEDGRRNYVFLDNIIGHYLADLFPGTRILGRWHFRVTRNGELSIYEGDHSPEQRDTPFVAPVAVSLRGRKNLFAAIRERDILLHHPYENFSSVVDFLDQAAEDPNVLAIKQTLYRTGGDPRIVGTL